MDRKTIESCNPTKRLGFNLHDMINTKEKTILGARPEAFEGENMQYNSIQCLKLQN